MIKSTRSTRSTRQLITLALSILFFSVAAIVIADLASFARFIDPHFLHVAAAFSSFFAYILVWVTTRHSPLYWASIVLLHLESWQQAAAMTIGEGMEVLLERRPGLERELRKEVGQ